MKKPSTLFAEGFVTPIVQFSNHLMMKFKEIYDLKALIPVKTLNPDKSKIRRKVA
jgi:hypothetical protein